jgi:hypothetical protein
MPTVSRQSALTGLTDEVRMSNASVFDQMQAVLKTRQDTTTYEQAYEQAYEEYDYEYSSVQQSVRTVETSAAATFVTTNTMVQQTRHRSPSPRRKL